jgi:DNA-directed RNA polymerase subunit RPC12/RpoP
MKKIKPEFDLKIDGLKYLGRGPKALGIFSFGWSTKNNIVYRCVICGNTMLASKDHTWKCECGALHLDKGMSRFDSEKGDINILVYKKRDT